MQTTYTLKSHRLKGYIEITFLNGVLKQIKFDLNETFTSVQWEAFKHNLGYNETMVQHFASIGFEVSKATTQVKEISLLDLAGSGDVPIIGTNLKIALFCRLYEKHTTVKYKVSPADSGKIKLIKIEDALLTAYFTSQNFLFKNKYSIANLTKYYNELLAEIATAGKPKHPNSYSKAYEAKLPVSEISGYWIHLRSLGLQPKKDRVGNTIDWVSANV